MSFILLEQNEILRSIMLKKKYIYFFAGQHLKYQVFTQLFLMFAFKDERNGLLEHNFAFAMTKTITQIVQCRLNNLEIQQSISI